jgi:8-oxo-dGTP pyrophosphatase MutT (NUDIX family)
MIGSTKQTKTVLRLSACAVIRRPSDKRFLMIEELVGDTALLDFPGGTWETGETLLQCAVREAAEEACIQFHPERYLGAFFTHYVSRMSGEPVCNTRVAFVGSMSELTMP